MTEPQVNQYRPDYVSPPGETLRDAIAELRMSQVELSERTGKTTKAISEIIMGKASITPDTALQFERVLGIDASFWNNLQRLYDDFQARVNEQAQLRRQIAWLKNFPIAAMTHNGWIKKPKHKAEQIGTLLSFFGVATPDAWHQYWSAVEAQCRQSATFSINRHNTAVWLRCGELVASSTKSATFDLSRFREELSNFRSLTVEDPVEFVPKLKTTCAECGVIVAFIKELPKTPSGATRWLASDRALIQLSLKYNTDDHFWFTFFHEVGHILCHSKKQIFLEDRLRKGKEEEEANDFAAKFLVPEPALKSFIQSRKRITKASIVSFARELQIAPGIVVGQLQYRGHLPFSFCNDLKRKFRWK